MKRKFRQTFKLTAAIGMIARDVNGDIAFTRKLCPFPKLAVYDGKSPTADASSYHCGTDPTLVKLLSSGD
jgi:hypothetical protein